MLTSKSVAAAGPAESTILDVLDRTLLAMDRCSEVPYLMIGEIGSAIWGRDRGTKDIDLLVRPESLPEVLAAFEAEGFDTFVKFEHWLYKAAVHGIEVDILFRAAPDIMLDEEMLTRASVETFRGRSVPIAPPEDLIVMKAVAATEDTARYWYDALGIVSRAPLDWSYLVRRSCQHGARRMLSLLVFATSNDLVVPPEPIQTLMTKVGLMDAQDDA
jgi:predicted nucleotidyltransferase